MNRVLLYDNSSDSSDIEYDYDDLGQLTEEDAASTQAYQYDLNGNRTMTGYETGPGNRLVDDGTYTYAYDDEGNLISRTSLASVLAFTWDNRNRLIDVSEWTIGAHRPLQIVYEYDTFDRRVARTQIDKQIISGGEGNPSSTITTTTAEKYIHDGDHVVLDFFKPNGGSYTLAHRYLYGPDVDQVLAQENVAPNGTAVSVTAAGRVYWFLTDNLGTVRDLLDADGDLAQHYVYNAFGKIVSGSTSLTRYLYTAREFDAATGLQYNRARWYDPATGRWLSEDPLGFAAGDANLFRYVGNGPTNYRDPSGLIGSTPSAEQHAWLNDPNIGSKEREQRKKVWDRTEPLRVNGGEGAPTPNSGPNPPPPPPPPPPPWEPSPLTEMMEPKLDLPRHPPWSPLEPTRLPLPIDWPPKLHFPMYTPNTPEPYPGPKIGPNNTQPGEIVMDMRDGNWKKYENGQWVPHDPIFLSRFNKMVGPFVPNRADWPQPPVPVPTGGGGR